MGAKAIIEAVNQQLGGNPASGVDEKLWLSALLTQRWGGGGGWGGRGRGAAGRGGSMGPSWMPGKRGSAVG